jgi:hypothetical protein
VSDKKCVWKTFNEVRRRDMYAIKTLATTL